jgi:Flp pilus assembly protein protease CpaA
LLTRPIRRVSGKKGSRVPYGIAIAVGVMAMILLGHGSKTPPERQLPPINSMSLG